MNCFSLCLSAKSFAQYINCRCESFVMSALISLCWNCNGLLLPIFQAVIFVDNSGADIILGILPFARELLRRGTQVWIILLNFLSSGNKVPFFSSCYHFYLQFFLVNTKLASYQFNMQKFVTHLYLHVVPSLFGSLLFGLFLLSEYVLFHY